jgi:uncharacterized Zn-binding protein involved in type VI secretion
MFPAARTTDLHVCPMFDGPIPHVGGPILPPGNPTVLIGLLPAACEGDPLTCVGPPDEIVMGGPAARVTSETAHGGVVTVGCPTVLIGMMPQAAPLRRAAENGTPFCEECEKAPTAGDET